MRKYIANISIPFNIMSPKVRRIKDDIINYKKIFENKL